MQDIFKIYIDRLRDGQIEVIKYQVEPHFLEIFEKELVFKKMVDIRGKAYVTQQNLIVQLYLKTSCSIPCAICSEMTERVISIPNIYYTKPLDAMKDALFDFSELVRETILLDVPQFVECNSGVCPKRDEINKYLKNVKNKGYYPFQEL